jgi:hypothetical protein
MSDLDYLRAQGLGEYIDFSPQNEPVEFAPEPPDLARIHKLIRARKCFTALEFGVGYSTIVIADALRKNKREWEALTDTPKIRNRFMFHCFTVDASEDWLGRARAQFPEPLKPYVTMHHSPVKIGTHNGQLCHFYTNLPDVVPDFIYLDGPDPNDVEGSINGLSFRCDERTVMAGDILLMEPTLLPGCFILVDGRTNNARFLARNFTRDFATTWDRDGDVTTFELVEARLGPINILGTDILG